MVCPCLALQTSMCQKVSILSSAKVGWDGHLIGAEFLVELNDLVFCWFANEIGKYGVLETIYDGFHAQGVRGCCGTVDNFHSVLKRPGPTD